ncbi:MlaC/ttg2D family ABC transporter substrate-binding protein [Sulfuriflexus mobilis]|uniref:MlaC/ttg2D family ABC transporter substrate-binding protein n=1 Tax=Sulfuriflexus mobilis TaxID=1811807 RepID=UPI00155881D8|nr:ABC transporter substrate-binding protein [Sulfuriflexus mobilis]
MRYLTLLTVLLMCNLSSLAAEPLPSARALVQKTAAQVTSRIRADRPLIDSNPQHLQSLIDELMMPHIDFQRMSKWVLGKYWRRASDEQREQFATEFSQLILRTYSTALLEYSDQEVAVLPVRAAADAREVTVRTEVQPDQGPAIPIAYDLYLNPQGQWKVYDVSIDGISLIANYRSSFSSQIRRSGISALLTQLHARNQQAIK